MALVLGGCTPAGLIEDEVATSDVPRRDLPAIQRLTITENGVGSPNDANPPRGCSGFMLDEGHVRRFMDGAGEVGQRDYMHNLDWSPCHARGRLEFADGRSGVWTVRQFRTGSIMFDDGGEVFLFCPSCTWEPFAW
ncbi:hypothetical protein [Lysobacter sp. F6437]|uniref:hypothetical protein n=1 Tax=Lysobacter sp. F6437 TaxID=3459296 RepID=UPI00403E34D0